MIAGGVVELLLGVPAERKELEPVARQLSAVTATQVPRATLPQARYSPSCNPSGIGSAAS
jgi:hypothetical protein